MRSKVLENVALAFGPGADNELKREARRDLYGRFVPATVAESPRDNEGDPDDEDDDDFDDDEGE